MASRRELLTGLAALLAAPAMSRAERTNVIAATGEGRAISARVRLPGGTWKRFSCSFPPGCPVELDAALACVRERNAADASEVADLTIA